MAAKTKKSKKILVRRSFVQTNSGSYPGLIIEKYSDPIEQLRSWRSNEVVVKDAIDNMLKEVERIIAKLCGHDDIKEAQRAAEREPMALVHHAVELHYHLLRAKNVIDSDDKWQALRAMLIVGDAYATMWVAIHETDAVRGKRHRLRHKIDWDKALIEWIKIANTQSVNAECDRIIAERYETTPGAVKTQRQRKKITRVQ